MAVSVYARNKLATTKLNESWTKLLELIPPKTRVLDVGCSSGNFGAELAKRKQCKVIGIDINEADLKLAQKQLEEAYKRNIEQDTINDLGKFDIIVMADVIEHLAHPVIALNKLSKQLKEDGKIVFSVPNMANFAVRLELLAGRFSYTEFGLLDETHLHYYDRVELEKTFTKSNLHVEQYNNTIRDTPRKAVIKLLKDVGLTPTAKFWELAEHIDSVTFQFIGIATKGRAGHVAVHSQTPHDFVSQMMDDINATHSKERSRLKAEIQTVRTELKSQAFIVQRLQKELRSIYDSKAWKLISKLRDIHGKINV